MWNDIIKHVNLDGNYSDECMCNNNTNWGSDYSVIKVNFETDSIDTSDDIEVLYDCIPDLRQADLLAQLAMCNKQDDELIYITAGWNRSIDIYHPEEYKEALRLAEKHKISKGGL